MQAVQAQRTARRFYRELPREVRHLDMVAQYRVRDTDGGFQNGRVAMGGQVVPDGLRNGSEVRDSQDTDMRDVEYGGAQREARVRAANIGNQARRPLRDANRHLGELPSGR